MHRAMPIPLSYFSDKGEPFGLDFCVLTKASGRVILRFK